MSARQLLIAALSALGVLSTVADAKAQHWATRPQDWGQKGIILFPPNRDTGSTFPVMVYPEPKPVPPPKLNLNQFQRFDGQGRPVFTNPATGQTTVGNATGLIGVNTTLGEIRKMNAARPPVQPPPSVVPRRR